MNKNDLVSVVSDKAGLSKADAAKAVDAVIDAITASLRGGTEVRLVGFGTFLVSSRAASTGRNPRTGEAIDSAEASGFIMSRSGHSPRPRPTAAKPPAATMITSRRDGSSSSGRGNSVGDACVLSAKSKGS